jgi:hypothetical protein
MSSFFSHTPLRLVALLLVAAVPVPAASAGGAASASELLVVQSGDPDGSFTDVPYVVSLSRSATTLTLRASPTVGRKHLKSILWAIVTPADRRKSRGGRTIVLESFDGSRWRRFAHPAKTRSTGLASWTLHFRRGTYVVRARFAGTVELAPAASPGVRMRVR